MRNRFLNRMIESLNVAVGVLLCLVLPLVLGISGCWAIMTLLPSDVGIWVALLYIVVVTLCTFATTQSVTRYMNAADVNRHLKQHDKED